jgi:hypothetical protein
MVEATEGTAAARGWTASMRRGAEGVWVGCAAGRGREGRKVARAGCDGAAYLEAEERARRQGLGVWRVPGGITRPWDFRRGRRSARIPDGTTPDGRRHFCSQIGSHARAQELLRQGHSYLDSDGDGEACESLRP